MDFDLSERSEQWRKQLQAFFDTEVLPRHRAWLEHTAVSRETPPFMARAAAEGARGGIVESRPARTWPRRAGHAPFQSRICAAGRDHGAAVLGARSLQLPGARRAQHDRAAELRHAGAEGALAAAAARSQNPLGVRHDRAGCRLVGRDQHRDQNRSRRRRLHHQRPQMVHHRRRASALQLSDRDGRDQFGCRPHPPPFLHHRADGCARRPAGAAAALDGLRGSCRADRRTRV